MERPEIVFFDLETVVPTRPGQGFAIVEFGAILVCPMKLVEQESFSTLVRPSDLSRISSLTKRSNGITKKVVAEAPAFADIADKVYEMLHGRLWAGHNIIKFDSVRIREAFEEIGRSPPKPKKMIDSLVLLTQKFGRRAGDMKMASLASYFGLKQQTHRSLDDVRLNLEVLKYCATVLFVESSLPDIFPPNSWISPAVLTRSRTGSKASPDLVGERAKSASDQSSCSRDGITLERHPIISLSAHLSDEDNSYVVDVSGSGASTMNRPDAFDMNALRNELDATTSEAFGSKGNHVLLSPNISEDEKKCARFLELDAIQLSNITARPVKAYNRWDRIKLFHNDDAGLQLCCPALKVRFGIKYKFVDAAGRPKPSFVVDVPPKMCEILDTCDNAAKNLFFDSGIGAEWKPVITRKPGLFNTPTARIKIPRVDGENSEFATEIHRRDPCGTTQKVALSSSDTKEIEPLINPGDLVDAWFWLETYSYQLMAGIRLVAKKLVIDS